MLAKPNFGFLGLIGSGSKRARFMKRLGEGGIPPAALARLTCPIGIGTLCAARSRRPSPFRLRRNSSNGSNSERGAGTHDTERTLEEAGEYLLELDGLTKSFPGVLANDDVSFRVGHGEIHALLGENGAGKSTLVKMIYGVLRPDSGTMHLHGETYAPANPSEARAHGIGMVFQHFSLFEALTVAGEYRARHQPGAGQRATCAAGSSRSPTITD